MPRYRDRTRRYPVREHLARPFCMHPAISIAPQIPRSSFRLFYESQDAADFALKFIQICPNCHFCDYTTSFCTLCSSYLYQILCVFVVARPLSFLHPSPLEFGQICPNRITPCQILWLHDSFSHPLIWNVEIRNPNRIALHQILRVCDCTTLFCILWHL